MLLLNTHLENFKDAWPKRFMKENMECLFDRTADFCGIQKEIRSIRHEGTEMGIPEA